MPIFPGHIGSLLSVSQVEPEDPYQASSTLLPAPRLCETEAWSVGGGLPGEFIYVGYYEGCEPTWSSKKNSEPQKGATNGVLLNSRGDYEGFGVVGHWISSHLAGPLQMQGGTSLSCPWQPVLGPFYSLTQEVSTKAVPSSFSVRLLQLRLVVEPMHGPVSVGMAGMYATRL